MKILGLLLMYVSYGGITDFIVWQGCVKHLRVKSWMDVPDALAPLEMRDVWHEMWVECQRMPNPKEAYAVMRRFVMVIVRVLVAVLWPAVWITFMMECFPTPRR